MVRLSFFLIFFYGTSFFLCFFMAPQFFGVISSSWVKIKLYGGFGGDGFLPIIKSSSNSSWGWVGLRQYSILASTLHNIPVKSLFNLHSFQSLSTSSEHPLLPEGGDRGKTHGGWSRIVWSSKPLDKAFQHRYLLMKCQSTPSWLCAVNARC